MILQSASSQHMRRLAWWSGSMEGGVRMGSTSQFSSDSYNARINSPAHTDNYHYQQWQCHRHHSCHPPILNSPTTKKFSFVSPATRCPNTGWTDQACIPFLPAGKLLPSFLIICLNRSFNVQDFLKLPYCCVWSDQARWDVSARWSSSPP